MFVKTRRTLLNEMVKYDHRDMACGMVATATQLIVAYAKLQKIVWLCEMVFAVV